MKKSSGFLDFLLSYLVIMGNQIYLLIEPLIFATVGLIYRVPWQYYLISIGGFYLLMLIWEVVCRIIFKDSEKKYHCPLVLKFKRMVARFSEESKESAE